MLEGKGCVPAAARAAADTIPVAAPLHTPPLPHARCRKDRATYIIVDDVPLFFKPRDGAFYPTLRLLHKCAYHAGHLPPLRCLSFCHGTHTHSLTHTRTHTLQTPL